MITIKRNCSSSIHDNPIKDSITFGAFTIRIDGYDYRDFDWLKNELNLKADELLHEIIFAGLGRIVEQYGGADQ